MSLGVTDISSARKAASPQGAPAQSGTTPELVYDGIVADLAESYLQEIDPDATGLPAPSPSSIKQELLRRTNARLDFVNAGLRGAQKAPRLKTLPAAQIGRILICLHHAVTITAGGLAASSDRDILGIYAADGPRAGTYLTGKNDIEALARTYDETITVSGLNEVMSVIRNRAPRVERCTRRNLIPVANGVFDYDAKQLLPFDPGMVFLSKSETDLDPAAVSPVIHNDQDGTDWEVEEWVSSLSDDPDVVALLWQIIGAIVRPHVRWNKAAWFYSEEGNNGKGTLCELMRNLVGKGACSALPLSDFGKDFMLEPLIGASAIICDENNVGQFLDKVANLKAVITNDVISINRKGLVPVAYRFWGFMVQCLNEFPQIRDRSESFYRRQLFVPFEKNFKGIERRYIKDDYLARPEVLRYVLKRVLLDTPDYYVLDEPEATKRVMDEYKQANDPVREFWSEMEERFVWDLLPFGFLYDLYKAWFANSNPSGKVLGKYKFISNLLHVVRTSGLWYCRDKSTAVHTGSKMSIPEPLIAEFDLAHWTAPGYAGRDPAKRCTPATAQNYRGLERFAAAGPAGGQTAADASRQPKGDQ